MKRWVAAFVVIALACIPILALHASSPSLLQDTDTAVMLAKINERHDPLSWFHTDWPLENHFYRPISTLTFEMDLALWGKNPAGFGWTNALLCVLAVLALFWAMREITDDPFVSAAGAFTFAAWNIDMGPTLSIVPQVAGGLALLFSLLPGRKPLAGIGAFLVFWYLGIELQGMYALSGRMLEWIPGRTASTMTVFAMLAIAAYARYERVSANRVRNGGPQLLAPPPTKGTAQRAATGPLSMIWVLAAGLFAALALLSYEQAVMLPAVLFGVGICFALRGYKVRWGWHVLFWGLLGAYLLVRSRFVPLGVSGYQSQQFRSGGGVYLELATYLMPTCRGISQILNTIEFGWIMLLISTNLKAFLSVSSNVWAVIWARRRWVLPLTFLMLSFVAILPMAWLHHFEHYHYWPMALRAGLVAVLLPLVFDAFVSAASRPAIQAPPRLDPAPGSLVRP